MSQWVDEKYIALVGSELGHFRKQSRNTFTFRCPFCGDSQKRTNRTRGYFYLFERKYLFKCHNCGESLSFRAFLKRVNDELFREYQMDILRDERPHAVTAKTPPPEDDAMFWSRKRQALTIPSIASLPDDHIAKRYCVGRGLPDDSLAHLYFTDQWVAWVRQLGWDYFTEPREDGSDWEDHAPRLVIPWFSRKQELLGAQCRRIDVTGKASRYVTLKAQSTEDKVYGLDRVNFHERIYLVEGPLDSWFLPNAMAAMGSDLLSVYHRYLDTYNVVLVWDHEPRNPEVVRHVGQAVKQGLPVVIWPASLKATKDLKDLNEMAQEGYNVLELVQQHTFTGLRAELEYLRWKR